MKRIKEIGYDLIDVIWRNIENFDKVWNMSETQTKDKVVEDVGELAAKLSEQYIKSSGESHVSTVEVSRELLSKTSVTDDTIYKDLLKKLIDDTPRETLKKFFHFSKIDPVEIRGISNEDYAIVSNMLAHLEYNDTVLYKVMFNA